MNKALIVLLCAVTFDAIGMGLAMPVLPGLIREFTGQADVALTYGALLAVYGAMQFLFAPVLGALSDRFGRRPVLLVSLAGGMVDYVLTAVAPSLWVLALGRLVAGITAANMAVATAYIADTTDENRRAVTYGRMGACFGLGFIAGPALGGLLGGLSLRAPFLAAAALAGLTFLLALFFLPESHKGHRKLVRTGDLNAFAALHSLGRVSGLRRLIFIYVALQTVGQVPATLWVIYGQGSFGWTTGTVGLSLAIFGALHALVQAFATGPMTARFGERHALVSGMVADGLGNAAMAFATHGWMAFAALPLLALGGIAAPALQALMSFAVGGDRQGELQGALAGLASLAGIVGPLAVTALYAASSGTWKGLPWLIGALLYALCLPLVIRIGRKAALAGE